jgi:hypothetical protein
MTQIDLNVKFELPKFANYISSQSPHRSQFTIDIGELDESSMRILAKSIADGYIEHWRKRKAQLAKNNKQQTTE